MVRPFLCLFAALAAGCGLISDDIDDLDLSLPNKTYTVDTDSWQIPPGEASLLLSRPCDTNPSVCAAMGDQLCPTGTCESACGATMTCDLIIPIHPFTTVNLAQEKEELATINEQALIEVVVDTISFAVTENTLDRATPPFRLYVAPETVMTPDDPQAVEVGTIPAVAAMMTVATTQMAITATGRAGLVQAMTDFRTPFNIIVGADLVLTMGDQIPTGRLTASMTITAHASAF